MKVCFIDGTAEAELRIERKTIPATGDAGHPGLWMACIAIGAMSLILLHKRRLTP